jgi:hypothetical protein
MKTASSRPKEAYKDGERDGQWTTWHESGRKEEEGHYLAGDKDGPWTFWHESGQKAKEGRYKKGRRDGPWTTWHIHGGIASKRTFQDPLVPEEATEAEEAALAAIEELGRLRSPISYEPSFTVTLRLHDATDEALAHVGNLPKLEELFLMGESFTDEGLGQSQRPDQASQSAFRGSTWHDRRGAPSTPRTSESGDAGPR